MLYFDNNATTLSPKEVCVAAMQWVNIGNPSADHVGGRAARQMMKKFRDYLGEIYGVSTCCLPREEEKPGPGMSAGVGSGASVNSSFPSAQAATVAGINTQARAVMAAATHLVTPEGATDPSLYKVIFTSGASEANATIIQSAVYAAKKKWPRPHLVASQVEHKSVLATLEILRARGDAEYSLVPVDSQGKVSPADVASAIREETCLVCVMHANNETGAINPIADISREAHARNVPFHCDIVQTAGRIPPDFLEAGIDSAALSFHKFHGFAGAGALIVKQQFLLGYGLEALIPGTQNDGLRGGTENIVGIAAGLAALQFSMRGGRAAKNSAVLDRKLQIISTLSEMFPARTYLEYLESPENPGVAGHRDGPGARPGPGASDVEIVFISGIAGFLPNTILLSVVRRGNPRVCNKKIKAALAREQCIISVGSACNTSSASASHVLYALGADEFIRAGALRISLGDSTTSSDCLKFCGMFYRIVRAHLRGLEQESATAAAGP